MAEIGLNVADLEVTCANLKDQGVVFIMEPADRPGEGIRLARVLDPDGTPVTLAQSMAH